MPDPMNDDRVWLEMRDREVAELEAERDRYRRALQEVIVAHRLEPARRVAHIALGRGPLEGTRNPHGQVEK